MRKRLLLLGWILLLAALVLAGCGGDDDDKEDTPTVEFTYQEHTIQVTKAHLQTHYEDVGQGFDVAPGYRFLVLDLEVLSGAIPGLGVDWTLTVIDEAGTAYGSTLSTGTMEMADDGGSQVREFGRVYSVPEQVKTLTLDIDGTVQVDITPILTRE